MGQLLLARLAKVAHSPPNVAGVRVQCPQIALWRGCQSIQQCNGRDCRGFLWQKGNKIWGVWGRRCPGPSQMSSPNPNLHCPDRGCKESDIRVAWPHHEGSPARGKVFRWGGVQTRPRELEELSFGKCQSELRRYIH